MSILDKELAPESFEGEHEDAEEVAVESGDLDTAYALEDGIELPDIATDVALGGFAVPSDEDRVAEQFEGGGPR